MTAEQNYRLLQEIDANRKFILMAYLQNPKLVRKAEALLYGNAVSAWNEVDSGSSAISFAGYPVAGLPSVGHR